MALFPVRRVAVHSQGAPALAVSSAVDPWAAVDGRMNAPTGAAPQFPTILNQFPNASPPNARVRWPNNNFAQPPWMVAGVDYLVGIDRSRFPTNAALANPNTLPASPGSGFTWDATGATSGTFAGIAQVVLSGSGNYLLDGYDLAGAGLGIPLVFVAGFTGTAIIRNCNFLIGTSTAPMIYAVLATSTSQNVTVEKCELNCNQVSDGFSIGGSMGFSTGTLLIQYNYFNQWSGRGIVLNPGNATQVAGLNATVKYNLWFAGNWTSGEHADGMQLLQGCNSCVCLFNTCYQPAGNSLGGPTGKPGFQNSHLRASDNNQGALQGVEFGWNTCHGVGHTGHSENTGDGSPATALGDVYELGTAGTTAACDTHSSTLLDNFHTAFGGFPLNPSTDLPIGGHLVGLLINSNTPGIITPGTTVVSVNATQLVMSAAANSTNSQTQIWITNDRPNTGARIHDNYLNYGDTIGSSTTNVALSFAPGLAPQSYPNGPPFWNLVSFSVTNNTNMFDGASFPTQP